VKPKNCRVGDFRRDQEEKYRAGPKVCEGVFDIFLKKSGEVDCPHLLTLIRCLSMLTRVLSVAFFLAPLAATAATPPSVTLHGARFSTEFAVSDAQRERGLMFRTELKPDQSMLFIFPDSQPRAFWMKNTLIPLDILYFDGARKLVAMQLNAQPCKADPCAIYPSDGRDAAYVLEVAAGTAGRLGLKLGETLAIEGAAPSAR